MAIHSQFTGDELHEAYHYVQEDDPGPVGSEKYWLKVSTGQVKRRNDANSGWITIGGGDIAFVGLTDVPASYSGQAGKGVRVKGDESGLEFGSFGGGLSFVTFPAENDSTGSVGDVAQNGSYLAVCIATDTWKKAALQDIRRLLTWASNGDTNGMCYFLGTAKGLGVWTNPHTAGYCEVVTSPIDGGTLASLVNRDSTDFATTNVANSFVGIDLGVGNAMNLNGYTLRNRASFTSESIRNWKLQGTNSVSANTEAGFNGASWTDLDTQVANTTLTSAAQWGHFTFSMTATAYRYLRILQNGVNSSGTNYLCLGEIEFYGKY